MAIVHIQISHSSDNYSFDSGVVRPYIELLCKRLCFGWFPSRQSIIRLCGWLLYNTIQYASHLVIIDLICLYYALLCRDMQKSP